MEGIVTLLVLLFFFWVIWRFIRGAQQRARLRNIEERLGAIEQQLGTRLRHVEDTLAKLEVAGAARPAAEPGSAAPAPAEGAKPAPPPAPVPLPVAALPAARAWPAGAGPQPRTAPSAAPPTGGIPPPIAAEGEPPVVVPAPSAVSQPIRPAGIKPAAPGPPGGRPAAPRRNLLEIEELLGTNWLSKLGISGLVLGVAYFLVWQMRTLGPAGKVLLGYTVGIVLLGAGIYFERVERYRLLARVGIGGGWPLLFFVTYAMYHVPAAHIPGMTLVADLLLMLVVAAAMVAHTLRYRSQMVTGLALLLAFLTITVNRESGVWSLTAAVVLAMAVAVLSVRMQWYELEVFGILATYLNHFYWLLPIIEPMGRPLRPFPEFAPSVACLLFYWATFRGSYLLRAAPENENTSTVAGLLNEFLLLAVLRYQSVYPQLAWRFLLGLGSTEFVLGQLPLARRRRTAFTLLTTVGVVEIFTAFPLHFSPQNTSLLWFALAEALLFAGIFLGEALFRRLGYISTVVAAGQILAVDAARVVGERMDGATYAAHLPLGLTCAITAAAFFFTAHGARRRWPALFAERWDAFACEVISWLAAGVAFAAVYVTLPYEWSAVVWMALGVALLGAAKRLREFQLSAEATVVAVLALLRALVVNLHATGTVHPGARGISLRLATLGLIAALCYLGARWGETKEAAWTMQVPAGMAWCGTGLLALLAWYELQTASIALAWALLGLVLLEAGLAKQWLALRLQAYALLLGSFLRIFYVNLNAESGAGVLSARLYTVIPLAVVLYYVYERLQDRTDSFLDVDRQLKAAGAHSWMGLLSVAALLRFELPLDWVVVAWAALVVVLLAVAQGSGRRLFISQSLVMALATAFRGTLHNFYERSYFAAPFHSGRYVVLGATAALLLSGLPIAFRLRVKEAKDLPGGLPQGKLRRGWRLFTLRPEQTLFFVALLLVTALLAAELRKGMVTVAWGLEAVAVFLFALKVGERSYRLAGLGLLLLCVGKIVLLDVWQMNLFDRSVTLMVLGASLFGVSVLYTRYREKIREYL